MADDPIAKWRSPFRVGPSWVDQMQVRGDSLASALTSTREQLAVAETARDAAQAKLIRWHEGERDEFIRGLIAERDVAERRIAELEQTLAARDASCVWADCDQEALYCADHAMVFTKEWGDGAP